jgi:hypothetical protein
MPAVFWFIVVVALDKSISDFGLVIKVLCGEERQVKFLPC